MTISTTTIKNSYSGDGSTTAFNYTFKITDQDDIDVIIRSSNGTETTKTITTHYSVSGVGNAGGGTVTFVSGSIPSNTETVVLRRNTPQTQGTDLIENDPLPANTLEDAFDKLTSITQELQEQLNRSLKVSRTATITTPEITDDATSRAGKLLGFDSTGNALDATIDGTGVATSAANAAASATAAASSATAAASSATAAQTAQAAAEAALDTFDDDFLGSKASDPSTDNDGDALADGALYFNTTDNVMKVYDLGNTQWKQLTPTASQQTNIDAAVANSTNINSVASNISNVNTVAGNSTNINTVAGNNTNINTVAGISANVTTVANNDTNITSVAGNATNINTVAGSITNVNNVGNNIASVNTAANNLADINAFANIYLGPSASAPTQDPDGTALDNGDLYFDTSSDQLKVYGSSGWQNAGSSVNGTSERFTYTISGTPTTVTGNDDAGNNLTYDAGFIDVYLNGVKQVNGTDVTVTSGSSVVFASALANNDVVDIVTFGTFNVAAISASAITSGTLNNDRLPSPTLIVKGDGASADAQIQLNCSVNTHGVKIKAPPHSAAQSYTLTLPSSITNGYFLKTDGSGNLSFAEVTGGNLTTVGDTFSNYNTISSNTTITTSSTANKMLIGDISVTGSAILTVDGNGSLSIV